MAKKKSETDMSQVTVKPAEKDASGMTATDRVIEANKAANYKPDTKATFTSGKRQEFIPGTNTVKEYDASGKLTYFGSADPETRMQVEAYNQRQLAQQQAAVQAEKKSEIASTVGQINQDVVNEVDPLTQDIAANIQGKMNKPEGPTNPFLPDPARMQYNLQKVSGPTMKILNKVGKYFGVEALGTSVGAKIADVVTNDEYKEKEIVRAMSDYSLDTNIGQIRTNLEIAENLKNNAYKQALSDPVKASENWNNYLTIKYKSYLQMKAIARADPKKFTELYKELTILETYFDETTGIKIMEDKAFAELLEVQ